jgi:hypothetical protein
MVVAALAILTTVEAKAVVHTLAEVVLVYMLTHRILTIMKVKLHQAQVEQAAHEITAVAQVEEAE